MSYKHVIRWMAGKSEAGWKVALEEDLCMTPACYPHSPACASTRLKHTDSFTLQFGSSNVIGYLSLWRRGSPSKRHGNETTQHDSRFDLMALGRCLQWQELTVSDRSWKLWVHQMHFWVFCPCLYPFRTKGYPLEILCPHYKERETSHT